MSDVPISRLYNLGRLGQTDDEIALETSGEERAALAKEAGLLAVPELSAKISLRKLSPSRFRVRYELAAEIIQACVVTLEPLTARIAKVFERELHHSPSRHRAAAEKEVVISPAEDDAPDEIESLHYDLAGPLLEEFLLALDPYPRAPGVEFQPPAGMGDKPPSPFAALKALKSGS